MDSKTGDEGSFEQLLKEVARQPSWLAPGATLLDGRFVIKRLLGSGGMGVVYEGTDKERNATVALKTLSEVDASGIYRLKQEFRALSDVVHPNLVGLHELFSDRDQWFFTMDLVPGDTLLNRLDSQPDDTVLRHAFAQLATGIQAIHDAGKLHRDLKPTNVLVTPEGRVVILDFGLASDQEEGGVGQTLVDESVSGTPVYMAPEQAAAKPASAASDWYAFGVMLFEALTGQPPFAGRGHLVLVRKQQEDAPRPSSIRKDTPEDLEQLCAQLLQRDPEARSGWRQIMQVLGPVGDQLDSLVLQDEVPFVGRVEEIEALRRAFVAVDTGSPVVVFVHGVSGVGKTTLVEQFLQGLKRASKSVVLTGRCYERESVPFKAFDSLIDALSRYLRRLPEAEAGRVLPREIRALVRLFPALERVEVVARAPRPGADIPDPFEVRRRGFAALKEMFSRISDRQPLVLHVDDLQWGDVDSAVLLQEVLAPPDPAPLLFIGSYRREEAQTSPFLQELFESKRIATGQTQVRDLAVDALGKAETERLVERLVGRTGNKTARFADVIARESEGIPYFVGELVRYAESEREMESLESGTTGALLQQLLSKRIRSLSEPARALLEVVAVAGRPIAQELALRAAEMASSDSGVVNTLRSANLIRTRGPALTDAMETYHDRIRETAVSNLEPERLRQYHARLAQVLEASERADAEWLLEQLKGANELHKAGGYAVIAADQAAQTTAFARAVELYRSAIELLQPAVDDPTYRELWTKLGESLANAGRGSESAEAFLRPSDQAPAGEAMVLKRRAAEQYLISGHLEEGFGLMRKVLATLGMKLPKTPLGALISMFFWQARVWLRGFGFKEREQKEITASELARMDTCWSLSIGLVMTDTMRSMAYISRYLILALRSGEPYRVALGLAVQSAATGSLGVFTKNRVSKLLQKADSLARRVGNPRALGLTETCVGCSRFCHGEWRSAYETTGRAIEIFREQCTGVAWESATARLFYLGSFFYLGKFRELSHSAPQLLNEAKQRGDTYAAVNFRSCVVITAWLIDDDIEQARRHVYLARTEWPFEGYHLQHINLVWADCLLSLYSTEPGTSWSKLEDEWSNIKASKLLWMQLYRVEFGFLRAASALVAALDSSNDDRSTERRVLLQIADKGARKLARENFPSALPYSRLIQAGVAGGRGEADTAISLLGDASDSFDAVDMPLHAAAARRHRGRLMGGEEGSRLIRDADSLMEGEAVKNPERMAAMLAPGFTG